jgi:thymidylate synthase
MRVGDPFCFMDYFEPYDSECKRKTTPCLLGINPKIINIDKQLFMTFHVMYRSWDLFSGYLTNNGGFQLLKEFMCSEISERANIDLKPGPTVTSCVDLHLYEEDIVAASTWTNHNIENLLSFLKECRNKKTEDLYKLKNLLN